MKKTAFESLKTISAISTPELKIFADDWLLEGEIQQLSPKTLSERKYIFDKLFWFVDHAEFQSVGLTELKQFFLHLTNGHATPNGRFDNPGLKKPLRPVSLKGWHNVIAAWFKWLYTEGFIESNPMEHIPCPRVREETKPPLSHENVSRLLRAARGSNNPRRDEAILYFLLDTGVRAAELCGLKVADVDLATQTFRVVGKGNKTRIGHIGRATTKALLRYLRHEPRKHTDYLFQSERGLCGGIGEPLRPNGLRQLIERLAKRAGIECQCSPHTLRRTFAVTFLRNGGNVFAAQTLMGHSTLNMTRKYCRLAEADVEAQHKAFGPADNLMS